jgi:hypothetical protein
MQRTLAQFIISRVSCPQFIEKHKFLLEGEGKVPHAGNYFLCQNEQQ